MVCGRTRDGSRSASTAARNHYSLETLNPSPSPPSPRASRLLFILIGILDGGHHVVSPTPAFHQMRHARAVTVAFESRYS